MTAADPAAAAKMRLFWSARSPFARKAAVVAHETGLIDRIALIPVSIPLAQPLPALSAANPLAKLPTLITGEGEAIVDSRVIAEYFGAISGVAIVPAEGPARWRALSRQALADELMAMLLLWRVELRRAPASRSPALLADHAAKLAAGLDHLERQAEGRAEAPPDIGDIAVGVLLAYLDFRFDEQAWRRGRAALAAWQAEFDRRPSMVATAFSG